MEKKKRGRKPKKKDENSNTEIKIPKKRGRKPKNIINNIDIKEELIFSYQKNEPNNYLNNNLILHLKINLNDLNKKKENQNIPLPYSKENYSLINNNICNIQKVEEGFQLKNIPANSKNDKFLEKYNTSFLKKNMYDTYTTFINNKEKWPLNSNIHCLWCVHKFDNVPCGIPIKYKDNKFMLKGCFCSFNCAASYIFDKNEYDKWEQYSLLNLLYSKIFKKSEKIKLAPDRELLKIFGGILDIIDFRNNFTNINIEYKLYLPPLIAIIPKVEETKINNENNFIPINENLLNHAKVNTSNDLNSFMDIKIKNK